MLLALVNGTIKKSKSQFQQTVYRANYRLFDEWKKFTKPEARKEHRDECEQRKRRWKEADLSVSKIVRAFRKAHKPIKDMFYTGCGLGLQHIDSQIAFYILFEMMVSGSDCCIPTLPIHDSFITFIEYEGELRSAMKMIYEGVMQQVTDSDKSFKIPVKSPKKRR
jgi:hypothetical protein